MKKICCLLLTIVMLIMSLNITALAVQNTRLNITPSDSSGHIKISDFSGKNSALSSEFTKAGAKSISWGYSSAKVHQILPVNTDRGTSLEVEAIVYNGTMDTSVNPAVTSEAIYLPSLDKTQTVNRNQMLYTTFTTYYNDIKTAVYFKTALKFPDANFNNMYCAVVATGNKKFNAFYVTPSSNVKTFNDVDTGFKFSVNKWFDVEGIIDCDTGYYAVSLSDGTDNFSTTGFLSGYTVGTVFQRLSYMSSNRIPSNDWTKPTSFYVDDIQIGAVGKLSAPVYKNYDFTASDIPAEFTTTGGTAAVSNGKLGITGTADSDTVTAMALPIDNTKFSYTADVTVSDLTADRSLVAGSVELARLGGDKKLYIGGAVVDGVTLTEGTYSADVIFDQTNHTATLNISSGSTLDVTENVSLGSSAVNLASVDWKIAAAADTVTALDNVTVRTIYTFGVDPLKSISGSTISAGDDVEIKFTNAVDISSFDSNSVKINDGAVTLKSVSKVDDWTVRVDFDKEQNTVYEIDFVGVEDMFGNEATASVTLTTERQDLILTDVKFTRDGQPLELATAGNVTATFEAKANNGTSFDMLYLVGLYQGGKLVDAVFDELTVGATREAHPLSITVPNDGKYYVVKAFVWDKDTLKPYAEPKVLKPIETDQPIAIVKLDDMTSGDEVLQAFERALAFAEENNIKMNFGLIGQYLDNPGTAESRARILAFYNNPLIELWSHAYSWSIQLGEATDEEQAEDFRLAHETAAKYGITYKTLSAPSGSVNAYTRELLNKYNFKVFPTTNSGVISNLEKWGMLDPSNTFTTLYQTRFNLEPTATGNTRDVETLKTMWLDACEAGDKFEIVQVHPNGWDGYEGSEQRFYDFLLWLKERGVIFMTFEEYVDYASML